MLAVGVDREMPQFRIARHVVVGIGVHGVVARADLQTGDGEPRAVRRPDGAQDLRAALRRQAGEQVARGLRDRDPEPRERVARRRGVQVDRVGVPLREDRPEVGRDLPHLAAARLRAVDVRLRRRDDADSAHQRGGEKMGERRIPRRRLFRGCLHRGHGVVLSCLSVGFRCDRRTAHCRRRQNGTGRRMPIRRMHARAPSPSARRSHPGALLISRGGGVMEPCANAPARLLPRLMRALRPTRSNSCLSITDAYDTKTPPRHARPFSAHPYPGKKIIAYSRQGCVRSVEPARPESGRRVEFEH